MESSTCPGCPGSPYRLTGGAFLAAGVVGRGAWDVEGVARTGPARLCRCSPPGHWYLFCWGGWCHAYSSYLSSSSHETQLLLILIQTVLLLFER